MRTTRKVFCDIRAVVFSRLPCRDSSRGGRASYLRTGGTGRTRASRTVFCDICAVETALSGRSSRKYRYRPTEDVLHVKLRHPFTRQSTYDARLSTRKRTANDESGSAPYVRSCICRSDRPISVAVSPFAAQMERPKGIASISCVNRPFRSARLYKPLGPQHGSYVFETALSGNFLRRTCQLSTNRWNRTHAGNTKGTLRHTRCHASRLPCRDVPRGERVSYPRTGRIGHTRTTFYGIRAIVLRDCPVGTFLTKVPLSPSRGCSAWKTPPPIHRTIHIRRAIIGQKAHG